jgi:uncharacterized protein YbbC (DUF1343 family)
MIFNQSIANKSLTLESIFLRMAHCFKIKEFMLKNSDSIVLILFLFILLAAPKASAQSKIVVGAESMEAYLPLIKGKSIAIVGNQTSIVNNVHLVDSLKALGITINKIFCPEHGFRGNASAGEKVADDVDTKTGIAIKSLYGNNKKPTNKDLQGVEIMVFDLQDVGARFYTYISTMHYVMQACAEQNISIIVLDRPNPNGYYVDGPVLQDSFASFVGMHKVPVVHGMTIGEYALMINGEKWLGENLTTNLNVIPCKAYTHRSRYILPINPSPNLPNARAVFLYPSLCFFEGTAISVGRGTSKPFQQYGHPLLLNSETSFVPKSMTGAVNPPFANEVCFGFDLSNANDLNDTIDSGLRLEYLINAYKNFPNKDMFFNSFFKKLAGNHILEEQIKQGLSEEQIKATWQSDILKFKSIRKKYLLYPDFE